VARLLSRRAILRCMHACHRVGRPVRCLPAEHGEPLRALRRGRRPRRSLLLRHHARARPGGVLDGTPRPQPTVGMHANARLYAQLVHRRAEGASDPSMPPYWAPCFGFDPLPADGIHAPPIRHRNGAQPAARRYLRAEARTRRRPRKMLLAAWVCPGPRARPDRLRVPSWSS
jgi:hypothetical protein